MPADDIRGEFSYTYYVWEGSFESSTKPLSSPRALCLNILNNVVLQENRATTQAVQSVERMYNLLVAGEISDDEVTHSKVLKVLTDLLAKKMEEMATHSRTSKLWIQYIKYVDIIKMFVTAERTGKWQDHLVNLNGH
ncbi:hypothetical protein GQR58_015234 [Nymphon striatum]|nr:hypothetical protein GQR58_015234 [Nymphon striatum]